MDVNEQLRGTWVLLHPDVYYDSANEQGCTGLINRADVLEDRFYVDVAGKNKLFASDHLMVLRESSEIYQDLMADRAQLEKQVIKDLYAVYLLRCSPEAAHYRRALEIASVDPSIRNYALITLEEKLGPQLRAEQQRSFHHGR